MKKLILIIALLTLSTNANAALSRGEGLACEALLCAVGIAIPESHNECRQVLTEWSLYLATLGFFRSKPKCPKKNINGHIVAYEEMKCSSIQNSESRNECEIASAPPENCDSYNMGSPEWEDCERYMCTNVHQKRGHPELCQVQP